MNSKFNVVYTGLQEGISAQDFISKFCSKFGISEQKARQIVNSDSDVVVKKDLDVKKAAQYRTAFESCGMIIRVDEIDISNYLPSRKDTTIDNSEESTDDEPSEQFAAKNINNPYETPEAPLERNRIIKDGQGSLEGGLNGDYDFSIGDIFSEAWEKTKGVKGTFLLAWGIYMLVALAISYIFSFISFDTQSILENLMNIPALYPIMAGITLMGIHRSVDADIHASSVLGHYGRVIPITLLTVLMIILITLGMMLLVFPGIYLAIAYMMALPLMMDRNMGVWESLETSRKAISRHWFRILFIYLLLGSLFMMVVIIPSLIGLVLELSMTSMVVIMIPFFIGLIWVLPLSSVIQGVMYKYIFGVESVGSNDS